MYLKVKIPTHSSMHKVLHGDTVELVDSNNMYANCYHPELNAIQLPIDWLTTESGESYEKYLLSKRG